MGLSDNRFSPEGDSRWRTELIANPLWYRIFQGCFLLLVICFGLQVFSPLRLNNDAIVLLSMADSAAHGQGFLDGGQKTVFPPGYPALLAILMSVGWAHSWTIISLNLFLLAVGLSAAYSLLIGEFFSDKVLVLMLSLFFLLSWVVIKHFTIPLTDVPFFCFAMCCLAVISCATTLNLNRRFVVLTIVAWICALAAITLRRIGVALIPPLIFMFVFNPQFNSIYAYPRRTKVMVVAISVILGICTLVIVARTFTLSDFVYAVDKYRLPAILLKNCTYRLTELGELFVNFPMSKMPEKLHFLIPCIGALLLLLTLGGLVVKRREAGPTELFLLGYMGILFAWPFYDVRFWLPVVPLLFAYSALSVKTIKLPRLVIAIYCCSFAALGLLAIAYSTRITFAGYKFPDRYGDGSLRATYCEVFQSCGDDGNSMIVDPKALRLLREFR
jgi:hypothetical protein